MHESTRLLHRALPVLSLTVDGTAEQGGVLGQAEWETIAKQSPQAQKVYDTLTAYLKEKNLLQ